MSERRRRPDEIRGASVVLTGWSPDRAAEVREALDLLSTGSVDLDDLRVPFLALERTSLQKAERAREILEEAGGMVELRDEWVARDTPPQAAARPPCPFCGSAATQPYMHAGPGARKRMTCTTCGRTFRADAPR